MIVGITGSQNGCTIAQLVRLTEYMLEVTELHHGDCIGADEESHDVAMRYEVPVVIHPPDNPRKRAWCKGAMLVLPEAPYLVRNRDIVAACDQLIGLPDGPERLRSGTWSTIRHAKSRGWPLAIIHPDGSITNA